MDRRETGVEIRGDTKEIESNLLACLYVQRWDRAIALLRQLAVFHRSHAYDLLSQYNQALEALVRDLVVNRNDRNLSIINNWVEVEMKNADLEPDARTFALKIKAALATLSGTKKERTVRRYWEMAKRLGAELNVASMNDVLLDHDLGKLSEIGVLQFDVGSGIEDTDAEIALDIASESLIASKRSPVVDVKETQQKGLGLSTLRKSLSVFSRAAEAPSVSQDSHPDASTRKRQSQLETDAINAALERWRAEHEKMAKMGINQGFQHGTIGALLWQWHQLMTEKLHEELDLIKAAEDKKTRTAQEQLRCEYGPYLRQLNPEQLAAATNIAVLTTMSKVGVGAPIKVARLVTELGKSIEFEIEAEKVLQNSKARKAGLPPPFQKTAYHEHRGSRVATKPYMTSTGWPGATQAKVGAILCELLFECARVPNFEKDPETGKRQEVAHQVFKREITYQSGKKVGTIALHPAMVKLLAAEPPGAIIAKQLPMVSPPRPWKGMYEGGFLESPTSFLRVKNQETAQREYIEAAAARGDLDQFFAGIDVLGRTAWKINEEVFQAMLGAWNSGEAIANLPPVEKAFAIPPKPSDTATPTEKYFWYQNLRKIESERGGLHSNRCFQNFQMEIARAYRDETFYLPHNVDFRGRAYPIPPYLNQMGADNARGLLLFAKGRPLGSSGLRWLKIHLANVFGYDKASLTDREQFATLHLEDILDSANNPLTGQRWWLKAECQWQCLATCVELKKAFESEDPSSFVSHLPIHQDGSCNGLQHYAALGGDLAGAKQVNLEPGDKPADVYTGVAELVKAEIKKEADAGHEMAKILLDRVTRKVVKQTVMTNVYGVTFLGAIRQVRKQLEEYMPDLGEKRLFGQAATYIARKIFKGLGAMFSGAHDIQYWLGDCVYRINSSLSPAQLKKLTEEPKSASTTTKRPRRSSKTRRSGQILDPAAFRSTIIWTTPLKLPVVQPYRVNKGRRVKTNLQDIILEEPSVADAVNRRKQLQAFPPNFIHSLDATHMVLSALKANELGLTFSAVHDSFWTHASDVDALSTLLRDAFIRMHSEDIIGRLAVEFKLRYKGHLYLANVQKSSPLGKALAAYRKTLKYKPGSSAQEKRHVELLREVERKNLLASHDPISREKGHNMVTAASLYEEHDGKKYLCSRDSLGETAIGAVPHDVADSSVQTVLDANGNKSETNVQNVLEPLVAEQHTETAQFSSSATTAASQTSDKPKKSHSDASRSQTWLWLPLTFKEVPKKGDFDVTRLRDSLYFFS